MSFIIYGSYGCGFTRSLLTMMNEKNIKFINKVSHNNNFNDIIKNAKLEMNNIKNKNKLQNYRTIPLVFFSYDNEIIFIGGRDDFIYIYDKIKEYSNYAIKMNKLDDFKIEINKLKMKNKVINYMIEQIINSFNK